MTTTPPDETLKPAHAPNARSWRLFLAKLTISTLFLSLLYPALHYAHTRRNFYVDLYNCLYKLL